MVPALAERDLCSAAQAQVSGAALQSVPGAPAPLRAGPQSARLKSAAWPPAAAFVDADEYIVLEPGVASLPALLQPYEGHGGLLLHWRLFASGGRISRPEGGGVLRSYTACCAPGVPDRGGSRIVKSIVQPQ